MVQLERRVAPCEVDWSLRLVGSTIIRARQHATVLFDHVDASSSTKRVDEASDASARSPCRAAGTTTSTRCTAPEAKFGRSSVVSTANSRWPTGRVGVPQSSAGATSARRY